MFTKTPLLYDDCPTDSGDTVSDPDTVGPFGVIFIDTEKFGLTFNPTVEQWD